MPPFFVPLFLKTLIIQNFKLKSQNKTVRCDLYMLFSLCAHKKLSHFNFVFMCINKLKNQRLKIVHISAFL